MFIKSGKVKDYLTSVTELRLDELEKATCLIRGNSEETFSMEFVYFFLC
jgi:hypothetical protein